MPTLIERVRAAVSGTPREFWPKVIANHAQAGAWDLIEALTALRGLQEPPPENPKTQVRLPPRNRLDRWDERPKTPTGRFVRAMSLDPVLDWSISDGAARCLQLVTSLAGGAGRAFVTLTCSIAKQLGRTTRTIQNYWHELAAAGLVEHSFDRRSGLVTVVVAKAVEPPPPVSPKKPAMWPRLPTPKVVWKRCKRLGFNVRNQFRTPSLDDAVAAAEAAIAARIM